ncbi:hypothetical protein AVEN_54117-1 [Araneus ventricosus]|uniref:Tc1-like transposase DDE domain-containing protein n=1 Tax=Araneus ventricosus TaxID=182803 RepID=A0A4Y2BUA7_ARAVE|nr:hypothetical protein AVEN_54117-1 [Araneus ventricosus]
MSMETNHLCIDPVCQQGTIQSGGASVMVWDVCSWRDMGPLIRLEKTLTGDRHFHWPPKSPELNIIVDIRDALLHAVEKRSPPPRTPMDLLTALQDSWCEFSPGYLQTPVESMPRRFASLLRACGGRHDIKKSPVRWPQAERRDPLKVLSSDSRRCSQANSRGHSPDRLAPHDVCQPHVPRLELWSSQRSEEVVE